MANSTHSNIAHYCTLIYDTHALTNKKMTGYKKAKIVMVIYAIIMLLTIVSGCIVGYKLKDEPEMIGRFFGRIAKGFNESSK